MPDFRLDSAYTPTADQPKAIDELADAVAPRRPRDHAARRDRHRQDDDDGRRRSRSCSARRSSSRTTRRWPRSSATSSARSSPTTRSSTSSRYYDYYQPEAYVPSRDLYIEKDSAINEEIDRLRHAATAALFARRDVIIVASVSCIFGLGSPETYDMNMQILRKRRRGRPRRAAAQARLDPVHAQRHGARPRHVPRARRDARGLPGLRGDRLPRDAVRRRGRAPPALRPAHRRGHRGRPRARRDLAGDALQRQGGHDRARGRGDRRASSTSAAPSSRPRASCSSRTACASAPSTTWRCCARSGFCNGIENYSRILDGRPPGERPYCLLDYFPDDFVCFIDESHQTVPQIGGMYEGDRSRKQTLVDYGFRLPERARQPAADVRRVPVDHAAARVRLARRRASTSATRSAQRRRADRPPDRHRRPEVDVRETRNQIDDLMNEIRERVDRERARRWSRRSRRR